MQVVTDDRYQMAVAVKIIAAKYSVPVDDLFDLVKISFEAGQRDGLTTLAIRTMGQHQTVAA